MSEIAVNPAGGVAPPLGTDGLGTPLPVPIATLPPLEEIHPTLPIDPDTAEPPHGPTVAAAYACLLLAAGAQAFGLALAWWRAIHMTSFPTAVRLLEWVNPRPGSAASIALAVTMVVTGLILVAAPALAGYLGWVGRPAAPWWATAACLLCAATYVITPSHWAFNWANTGWLAAPLCLLGAVLLWLPASRAALAAWQTFRHPALAPGRGDRPVVYGRLEQFR